MRIDSRPVLLSLGLALAALSVGFGCRTKDGASPAKSATLPTLRVYVFGGAAGAIEPCGCVKDMLGGVDHAAELVARGRKSANDTLVVGAGPMFFAEPRFADRDATQARFKAEAMADALAELGLSAWAPGVNDFAFGRPVFDELAARSKAKPLLANVAERPLGSEIVARGPAKIGIVGVSSLVDEGPLVGLPKTSDLEGAVRSEVASLKARGANFLVLLVAAPRGEALRLVEKLPMFQLAVLGKASDGGEKNDEPFPPELVEKTLVVQAPNHLQGAVVLDWFVRDGAFSFVDGSGIEMRARLDGDQTRRRELVGRIERWEREGVAAAELGKAKAELMAIEARLARGAPKAIPESDSYFLYDYVPIRETLGSHRPTLERIERYYERVNEHNREAFRDKRPSPPEAGQSRYLGVQACSTCHAEEHAFWLTTSHAKAYATLSVAHKEFNLDCVGCHVTGYEKPGGSTVTFVEGLENVQCEVCHGPGSAHVEGGGDPTKITRRPSETLCAEGCHHPPHVGPDWAYADALPKILGPGHGR